MVERSGACAVATRLRSPQSPGPRPAPRGWWSIVIALPEPSASASDRFPSISLFLDIGQGAGLAGATGVRPFLPPLLAGALASGDIGLDFDGTDYSFLERPGFLAGVLALGVLSYVAGRARGRRGRDAASSETADPREPRTGDGRDPLVVALGVVALALGALLFAGSLAGEGHTGWPGLLAGAACAGLAFAAATALLSRARRRLDAPAAALLPVWADGAAVGLAALSVFLPPVGLLSLAGFAWLLLAGRRERDRKFEGLRVLR